MTLDCMFGEETSPTKSAKMHVFILNPTRDKEDHVAGAGKGGDTRVSKITQDTFSAHVNDIRLDTGFARGQWTIARYQLDEGVVFKVYALKTSRPSRDSRRINRTQGAFYAVMRPGAALREVRLDLLCESTSRYRQATVKGNFDILSPEDLPALNIFPTGIMVGAVKSSNVERLFTDDIIARETQSRIRGVIDTEAVTLPDGQAVEVAVKRKKRLIKRKRK